MTGKRALLAWELGAGLGHARRLLRIAEGLQSEGFTCFAAARELWGATDEFRALGVPLLQAPHHQSQAPSNFKARGYADILGACGWGQLETLWPTVVGWDGLIDLVRPDVIVGDFSPILALAAFGRVPVVAIGDGFVLPPPNLREFPRLREDGTAMAAEALMLAHAAEVQRRRGLAVPESLPALVGGAAHVVCTYPETDVYRDTRAAPAAGPLDPPPRPLPPPTGPGIFAYLAADFGGTAKLLQALCNTRLPLEVFVRDAPASMRQALRSSGAVVHDRPPPLPEVLGRASLAVHHGGIGTIETCLALGRPQMLLPRHLEQTTNAAILDRLGASLRLNGGFTLADGAQMAVHGAGALPLRERATALAQELAGRPQESLARIIAHCRALA